LGEYKVHIKPIELNKIYILVVGKFLFEITYCTKLHFKFLFFFEIQNLEFLNDLTC
jgi:hypothetical protein